MNSLVVISFVMVATILGKWLLFDDDRPATTSEESLDLRVADVPSPPQDKPHPPYSKSA